MRLIKTVKTYFMIVLFFTSIFSVAYADNTIQLGSNRVGITINPVDDHIVCSLNGNTVAQLNFGDKKKTIDLTSKLIQGSNAIHCVVTDDNGGSCYSYNYQVWTGRDKSVTQTVNNSYYSCCDASCSRSNPVLDETIWINKP